eukprot:2105185-Pyramimonas_sp.AAC.1
MIEEEKAEKATERAARKAAAAAKNANAQKRVMPEGMTVVSKTGRSRTLNMSVDEATVSVDEARAASQQRLRSLMSGKQTPVSTVATVNDKGTLPHLPQYRTNLKLNGAWQRHPAAPTAAVQVCGWEDLYSIWATNRTTMTENIPDGRPIERQCLRIFPRVDTLMNRIGSYAATQHLLNRGARLTALTDMDVAHRLI